MDSEIVKKAKAGDSRAMEEIYNKTRQMVYFTALGIVKNEYDAEDLVQDTYIKVFENLHRLQDEATFPKWLKTIVINISKNHLKKKKPALFQDDKEEDTVIGSIEEVSENFLPQEYLEQEEKLKTIKNMVFDLPDTQRIAVTLYYYNELPLSEVSKIMETSDGTTKSRLNYARKQIKAKVDEQEKKGNKLYVGVPMLTRILHLVSQKYDLPAQAAKDILANSLKAANISAGTAAAVDSGAAGQSIAVDSAPVAAEDSAAETAANTTAGKGILAKIAGMSVKTRVIALFSIGVLLAGGGTGIAAAVKQQNDAAQAAIVLQQKQKAEKEAKAKAASEAAAKKAKENAASSQAKESSSQAIASATLSDHDKQIYKAYYDANFKGKAKAVFFADLTHDGNDEMLVTYQGQNDVSQTTGVLEIYTISNDAPTRIYKLIYDGGNSGQTYLYVENGKDYLYQQDLFFYSGGELAVSETASYSVFSLDASGKQSILKSDSSQYKKTNAASSSYSEKNNSSAHFNEVLNAMNKYTANSKLLLQYLSDEFKFGESDPDPFGESASTSSAKSSSSSNAPSASSQTANQSAFAQKLVGGWNWEGSGADGGEVMQIIFKANKTCSFEHSEKILENDNQAMADARPVSEEYSGTYQILDDNTILFQGSYQETSPEKFFSNSVKTCKAKFKIEWVTKDDQGFDFITTVGGKKGIKLTLIDGQSPISLMKVADGPTYFES